MNREFDAEGQLRELIRMYPEDLRNYSIDIEIYGVVLDFIARSGQSIEYLLSKYPSLYEFFFPAGKKIREETSTLMEAILRNSQLRSRARTAAKKHGWDAFSQLIDKIDNKDKSRIAIQSDSEVDKLARHRVEGVIWQLSDIHFGSLNYLKKDIQALAHAFGQIVDQRPKFKPRFIIISGDLSSSAEKDEFIEFMEFCRLLSDEVWGGQRAGRLLVVPGNHDTTWLNDGTADQLDRFKQIIAAEGKVITPFWPKERPNYGDELGRVTIHRYDPGNLAESPPFVLVHDKKVDLRVLLLVSPYYSGLVPENIRQIISNLEQHRERDYLLNLLREDTGQFSESYISDIDRGVWRSSDSLTLANTVTIAVTHHNLDQYGKEICSNTNAPLLLSTLAEKGINVVLHGHTHFEEDLNSSRQAISGKAYPIPCPALCGIPDSASTNGFMIHLVGPVDTPRQLSSAIWRINDLGRFDFQKEHLHVRYRFKVYKNHLNVKNVSR